MTSNQHFSPAMIFAELRQIADHIGTIYPASARDLREDVRSLEEQYEGQREWIDRNSALQAEMATELDGLKEQFDVMRDALHQIIGTKYLAGDEWDEVLAIANRALRVSIPARSPFPPPPDLTPGAVDHLTQHEDGSWKSSPAGSRNV